MTNWPVRSLSPGTRVRVISDPVYGPGPWPTQPIGTIRSSPTEVSTTSGPEMTYWVDFDEPQCDADGDGPYATCQILARYLEVLDA
jgi:hypothetical protein